MSGERILAVDDDPAILRALERGLLVEGFEVRAAGSGAAALEMIAAAAPSAVVLDVSMPGLSGIEVCARLRAEGSEMPILMLSALAELVLRLRALLRRSTPSAGDTIRAGPLVVQPQARKATLHGQALELTRREFDLLEALARNQGIVLSRATLLERVWGYDFEVTDNAVDTFAGYLRRKLEAGGAPRMIHTVRGVGFVLRAAS
jgi:two-component system response regulator PrrA